MGAIGVAGADTDFYKVPDKMIPIGENDCPFYGACCITLPYVLGKELGSGELD